ncbi:MAG: HAD-IIIA family hydrolase [Cytophagales bacterium]|nr:HAD-IIIA family hydrolase [Cytophagales bacterium]
MNKCIFLDRDGVLNVERGDYTFLPKDFIISDGVPAALKKIKKAGYLAVVVTNQAGISQGLFTRKQMQVCHDILVERTGHLIDKIYYSPYHPSFSESLTRKPETLMLEKAIAKFDIDPSLSWLIGDRARDIECGQRMGLKTVLITENQLHRCNPDFVAENLIEAIDKYVLQP